MSDLLEKAIRYQYPETIPVSVNCLPAAWLERSDDFQKIADEFPQFFNGFKYDPNNFSYIERLSSNRIASLVKISDLKHNSDESRLNNITEKDIKRNLKYKKALEFLLDKWR